MCVGVCTNTGALASPVSALAWRFVCSTMESSPAFQSQCSHLSRFRLGHLQSSFAADGVLVHRVVRSTLDFDWLHSMFLLEVPAAKCGFSLLLVLRRSSKLTHDEKSSAHWLTCSYAAPFPLGACQDFGEHHFSMEDTLEQFRLLLCAAMNVCCKRM